MLDDIALELERSASRRNGASEHKLRFKPRPVRLERRAWGVAEPETQSFEIIGRPSRFEPRLNGVAKLIHARSHGSVRGPAEPHVGQCRHLTSPKRFGRRNTLDESLGRLGEALREVMAPRERDDGAQQGAFVRAQYQVSRASDDDASVPVAEQSRWSRVVIGAAEGLQKRRGAPERDQPSVQWCMDVI